MEPKSVVFSFFRNFFTLSQKNFNSICQPTKNINQNIYVTPVDTNVTNNSPLTIISFSVPRTVFVTDELIREVGTNKTVNNVTDPLTKVNHSMRIIKELSLERDVSIENTI